MLPISTFIGAFLFLGTDASREIWAGTLQVAHGATSPLRTGQELLAGYAEAVNFAPWSTTAIGIMLAKLTAVQFYPRPFLDVFQAFGHTFRLKTSKIWMKFFTITVAIFFAMMISWTLAIATFALSN